MPDCCSSANVDEVAAAALAGAGSDGGKPGAAPSSLPGKAHSEGTEATDIAVSSPPQPSHSEEGAAPRGGIYDDGSGGGGGSGSSPAALALSPAAAW